MFINDQKGVSTVEFAIVLPLLLVFLFGIIEFGLLFYNKAMLTNASREGARAGIVYDFDDNGTPSDTTDDKYHPTVAEIQQVVVNYATTNLITFGSDVLTTDDVTVTPANSETASTSTPLTVTANYQYGFLVFPNVVELIHGKFTDKITLQAQTIMRFE